MRQPQSAPGAGKRFKCFPDWSYVHLKTERRTAHGRRAAVADGLAKPSSAARALVAGATHIERIDIVVQTLAAQIGMHNATVDETCRVVDAWLAKNRAA